MACHIRSSVEFSTCVSYVSIRNVLDFGAYLIFGLDTFNMYFVPITQLV